MNITEIKEKLRKARREVRVLERELNKAEKEEKRAKEWNEFIHNNPEREIIIELDPTYFENDSFYKCQAKDIDIYNQNGLLCIDVYNKFSCIFRLVKNIYSAWNR